MDAVDFDSILNKATDSDKELLSKWYKLDPDCVPPTYILQPISMHIAKYGDMVASEDEQDEATGQWIQTQNQIAEVFHQVADNDIAAKYLISSKSCFLYFLLYSNSFHSNEYKLIKALPVPWFSLYLPRPIV